MNRFFELESLSPSTYLNFYFFIASNKKIINPNLSTRLDKILFELYRDMINNTYEVYHKRQIF